MTRSKDPHGAGKGPFKWLAATIPLIAAMVPIIGAFEHWFGGGPAAAQASTAVEYAAVCNLSNTKQHELENDLAQFKVVFEHARGLTAARNAMLLLTKQDIAAASELQDRIQALTPSQSQAGAQRRLEGDLKANLTALGKYRERLGAGVASAPQLVEIAASLPRWSIEARNADARGRLLRLGDPDCSLDPEREQPIANWAPALRNELAANESAATRVPPDVESPHAGGAANGGAITTSHTPGTHGGALPDAEAPAPPEAESPAPPEAESHRSNSERPRSSSQLRTEGGALPALPEAPPPHVESGGE